jgi:hypothetical protein
LTAKTIKFDGPFFAYIIATMQKMISHVQRIVHNILAYTIKDAYGITCDSNGKPILNRDDWITSHVESYVDNIKDYESLIYEYGIDKAICRMQYCVKHIYQIDSKVMCFYILQGMVFEDEEIAAW